MEEKQMMETDGKLVPALRAGIFYGKVQEILHRTAFFLDKFLQLVYSGIRDFFDSI